MSVRRLLLAVVSLAGIVTIAWAGWWWWRATHPPVPEDTPPGWVPAVVVAAGGTRFGEPFGVALSPDGELYVTDAGEAHALWHVAADGAVGLVAGGRRGFADGVGASAAFDTPSHLAIGRDGALYVADTGNHAIRKVSRDGAVTTLVGDGRSGTGDGRGAVLNGPVGVAVSPRGRVFVADTYNDRVVEIVNGAVRTVAGGAMPGLFDGHGAAAQFDTPTGLAALADGSVVVADTGNDALRRIAPDGSVSTIRSHDPTGSAEVLWRPVGVAAASAGRLYVTEARARVTEVIADGGRRVVAGDVPGFSTGIGTRAAMREPSGIAVSRSGRIVVGDAGNGLVRVLDMPSRLGAWAPPSPAVRVGFDLSRFARGPIVWPLDPQDGPHEIAGTLGEPRGNPGGDGRERFHAGVDIRASEGAVVRAVRGGTVTSILASGLTGTLSEFLAVGPITYVHLRVGRDRAEAPIAPWARVIHDPTTGRPSRVRVPRGTFVAAGAAIGTANRFQHVHLNVGPPGEEANALLLGMPGITDTVPPVVPPGGITLTDLQGTPLNERAGGRVVVRGPVRIVAEAYDRMNDSPPRRRLGLYRVGFEVLTRDGRRTPQFVEPHIAITFDSLPSARDAPPSLYAPGSGIPFYGTRRTRFRYLVTSRIEHGHVVEAPWEPRLPPGDYVIRVVAEDAHGNRANGSTDLPIVVPPPF